MNGMNERHLSIEQLQRYAAGTMSGPERENVEWELSLCEECLRRFMSVLDESMLAVEEASPELPDMTLLEERVVAELLREAAGSEAAGDAIVPGEARTLRLPDDVEGSGMSLPNAAERFEMPLPDVDERFGIPLPRAGEPFGMPLRLPDDARDAAAEPSLPIRSANPLQASSKLRAAAAAAPDTAEANRQEENRQGARRPETKRRTGAEHSAVRQVRRRSSWLQYPAAQYAIAASITIVLLSTGVLTGFSDKLLKLDEQSRSAPPFTAEAAWQAEPSWSDRIIARTGHWLDGLQASRFK